MRYRDRYYQTDSSKTGCGLHIIVITIVVFILLFSIIGTFNDSHYNNVTVIDKGYSGSTDGYIIWVEDEYGTQYEFQNEDSLLRGKFNSGTVQGKLKVGSTYNIITIGWRIPFLSEYPNIIKYELVKENETE